MPGMKMEPCILRADELGIRLEVVNGLAIWEARLLYKHQKAVERIAPNPSAPAKAVRANASTRWMCISSFRMD